MLVFMSRFRAPYPPSSNFLVLHFFLFERMITKHHYLRDKYKKSCKKWWLNSFLFSSTTSWYWYLDSGLRITFALIFWVSSCFLFERMITEHHYLHDEDKNSLKNCELNKFCILNALWWYSYMDSGLHILPH